MGVFRGRGHLQNPVAPVRVSNVHTKPRSKITRSASTEDQKIAIEVSSGTSTESDYAEGKYLLSLHLPACM